jgi:hypothetical protein
MLSWPSSLRQAKRNASALQMGFSIALTGALPGSRRERLRHADSSRGQHKAMQNLG